MGRAAGILMAVSSLPGKYGIGSFDQEAYRFVDFLERAGQTYWQILPLNPPNHFPLAYDSPYQSFSTFAGNPYYISLDALIQEGWAREIVSKLQNLRKELKFEVTDRIHIVYDGPDEVRNAIAAQSQYISAETLAVSIEQGQAADMNDVEMNGVTAKFAITKA